MGDQIWTPGFDKVNMSPRPFLLKLELVLCFGFGSQIIALENECLLGVG